MVINRAESRNESLYEIKDNSLTKKLQDGIKRRVVFTVTGPSGVGKDRICNAVFDSNEIYIKPIAFTTRQPRDGEVNGREYYFISFEEFERMKTNGETFEYSKINNNYYGFTNDEMKRIFESGKIPICNVDEVGMELIGENVTSDFEVFKTFIFPPSALELKNRLVQRDGRWKGSKDKEGNKKRSEIISRFSESKHWVRRAIDGTRKYDFMLVNDNLEDAIEIVKKVFEDAIEGRLEK